MIEGVQALLKRTLEQSTEQIRWVLCRTWVCEGLFELNIQYKGGCSYLIKPYIAASFFTFSTHDILPIATTWQYMMLKGKYLTRWMHFCSVLSRFWWTWKFRWLFRCRILILIIYPVNCNIWFFNQKLATSSI